MKFPAWPLRTEEGESVEPVLSRICVVIVPCTEYRTKEFFAAHKTYIVQEKRSQLEWVCLPPPWGVDSLGNRGYTPPKSEELAWGIHIAAERHFRYLYQPWPVKERAPRDLKGVFREASFYWESGSGDVFQDGGGVIVDLQNMRSWEWYAELANAHTDDVDEVLKELHYVEA